MSSSLPAAAVAPEVAAASSAAGLATAVSPSAADLSAMAATYKIRTPGCLSKLRLELLLVSGTTLG